MMRARPVILPRRRADDASISGRQSGLRPPPRLISRRHSRFDNDRAQFWACRMSRRLSAVTAATELILFRI